MHGFTGERTVMRIYVGERDKVHGTPLYEAIVSKRFCREDSPSNARRGTRPT